MLKMKSIVLLVLTLSVFSIKGNTAEVVLDEIGPSAIKQYLTKIGFSSQDKFKVKHSYVTGGLKRRNPSSKLEMDYTDTPREGAPVNGDLISYEGVADNGSLSYQHNLDWAFMKGEWVMVLYSRTLLNFEKKRLAPQPINGE